MLDKLQVHDIYDATFLIFAGAMKRKIELIDGGFFIEFGLLKASFNFVLSSQLQFKVKKVIDGLKRCPVSLLGDIDSLFNVVGDIRGRP